jgi:hypothetical protein
MQQRMIEANYQRLLKPFMNANVYYPPTLEQYLIFTKRELDPDETVFDHCCQVIDTLLKINETIFPEECRVIREKYCNSLLMQCG